MKNDRDIDLDILDLDDLLDDELEEETRAPAPRPAPAPRRARQDSGRRDAASPKGAAGTTGSFENPSERRHTRRGGSSSKAGENVGNSASGPIFEYQEIDHDPGRGRTKQTRDNSSEDEGIELDFISLTGSLNEAMERSRATEGTGRITSMSGVTGEPDGESELHDAAAGYDGQDAYADVRAADRDRSGGRRVAEPLMDKGIDIISLDSEDGADSPVSDAEDDFVDFSDEVSYFEEDDGTSARGRFRRGKSGTAGNASAQGAARRGRSGRRGDHYASGGAEDSSAQESPRRGRSARGGGNHVADAGEDASSYGSPRRGIPVHLILPVVIVLVLIVAIVRLVIWNQGVAIDTTTNESSFNVEVNDNMVILSSSDQEGALDDGVTTILCLGNEPFSADTSETGLAGQIASLGEVEVINAAFPDSQVTCENATYSTETLDEMDDIFNLFYVAYAIAIDDYSSLATVASAHSDETYSSAVETLEQTDFAAVDIIAIQYDGIDYINEMAMYNEDVPTELTTYVGSLTNSFSLLREAYPHIRIVFMSPWYAEYDGASSRTTDLGNGTIVNYFQWAYDTCASDGISFLDNYYGSINENNFEEYLSDGVNLNEAGCTKIADHFVYKVIQGNYAEYNVDAMAVAE